MTILGLSYDYLRNLQNWVFLSSFPTLFGTGMAPVFVFTPKVASVYAYSLATAHYVLGDVHSN